MATLKKKNGDKEENVQEKIIREEKERNTKKQALNCAKKVEAAIDVWVKQHPDYDKMVAEFNKKSLEGWNLIQDWLEIDWVKKRFQLELNVHWYTYFERSDLSKLEKVGLSRSEAKLAKFIEQQPKSAVLELIGAQNKPLYDLVFKFSSGRTKKFDNFRIDAAWLIGKSLGFNFLGLKFRDSQDRKDAIFDFAYEYGYDVYEKGEIDYLNEKLREVSDAINENYSDLFTALKKDIKAAKKIADKEEKETLKLKN